MPGESPLLRGSGCLSTHISHDDAIEDLLFGGENLRVRLSVPPPLSLFNYPSNPYVKFSKTCEKESDLNGRKNEKVLEGLNPSGGIPFWRGDGSSFRFKFSGVRPSPFGICW
ncbi:hypothetical protein AKJ38_03030 [candidate division MSBL1 archaeon SCGC-AAA259I14]|uniref:Uncharacterized protein n=1 Tax=candidate division MSBL1 archaeon SCGC-AAA259I14 TaxID=1698268 RepID=A0A133UR25_9EURY|nr:hypothetical protein AKJ38_03030 [candidate division MSBL1 archaeon SCGC-AAA259I14]